MKKLLFPFFLLFALSASFAQTVTTTILTTPCTSNGVLRVNTTGLTPPLRFTYYFGGSYTIVPVVHSSVTTLDDTLTGWQGGYVFVQVIDTTYAYASATVTAGPMNYSFAHTSSTCPALGSITATVTGGTSPYSYHWYNPSGTSVGSANPLNALGGNYYLVATDAAGCYLDSRYSFDTSCYIPNNSVFSYTVNQTDASCTNGTASVTGITGGTSPFTYLWSNGATTAAISGLVMGYYSVSVTDANGCSSDSGYAYINQTPVISVYNTVTPATCLDTDGAIIAFGSGGVSPYSYHWSNGATTQAISGIGVGYYYVTATDANGCIGDGYSYVFNSTPITVTYATTPSSCTAPTGTATLTIAGGTTPYTVTWYTSPPQTGTTATALISGYYSFHVVDAVGCVQDGTVYVPPVAVINAGISITPATCTSSTGGVTTSASGGTTPYSYSWSTGSTSSSISSVASGTYSVTITDVNGCKVVKYPYVPVYSPLSLGFSTTVASCLYTSDGSITATTYGGTSPYTYSWNTGASGATISGLPTALYWVSVHDAAGCTTWDTISLGYDHTTDFCYCTLDGYVYFDANGNCTKDAGEIGINNIQMHCTAMGYTYTDTNGYYSFKVPTGTYVVDQSVLAFYPLSTCQSDSITVSATAGSGCFHHNNFADTIHPIHDIHISTWDYTYAVVGNTYVQTSIVTNQGTVTEPSILAGYKSDGQIFSPTFVPSGVFTSGGGYYYNTSGTFPSLNAGSSQQFFMSYNVPTNIPLGTQVITKDTVAYASPISNWLTDYSPWNNTSYLSTTIVGSYDPNFKEVSPKGYGANGTITAKDSVLEYMVHFQNTGTWYAQNIVVIDTLDADLDWSSLRPVFESHKCQVTISEAGVAKFTFSNINLPAQMYDDLRSNAMFTYTIKTKRGLNIGTQFKNRAAIYFDYNAPIYTNTTVNTLGFPESVPPVAAPENNGSFTLYPNPANNTFNIIINNTNNGTYAMRVSDITGKTMIQRSIELQKGTQTLNVDAASLSSGIYFVTIAGNDKIQTQKLVIIK